MAHSSRPSDSKRLDHFAAPLSFYQTEKQAPLVPSPYTLVPLDQTATKNLRSFLLLITFWLLIFSSLPREQPPKQPNWSWCHRNSQLCAVAQDLDRGNISVHGTNPVQWRRRRTDLKNVECFSILHQPQHAPRCRYSSRPLMLVNSTQPFVNCSQSCYTTPTQSAHIQFVTLTIRTHTFAPASIISVSRQRFTHIKHNHTSTSTTYNSPEHKHTHLCSITHSYHYTFTLHSHAFQLFVTSETNPTHLTHKAYG